MAKFRTVLCTLGEEITEYIHMFPNFYYTVPFKKLWYVAFPVRHISCQISLCSSKFRHLNDGKIYCYVVVFL